METLTITKEECLNIASGCYNPYDFVKNNPEVYITCKTNGYLKEAIESLQSYDKIIKEYSKDKCIELSSLCHCNEEFKLLYPNAYYISEYQNWLNEVCLYIQPFFNRNINNTTVRGTARKQKPRGYWKDKEICRSAAAECKSRNEYKVKFGQAYYNSNVNDWLKEFFPDSKQLKPINYWNDKEHCKDAAYNCISRSMFSDNYRIAFVNSKKNGWLDEFFPVPLIKSDGYWTKENCVDAAKECKNITEFKKNCGGAYRVANMNSWLKELFPNTKDVKPRGYWNDKENCKKETKNFINRSTFSRKKAFIHKEWLDEFLPYKHKPYGYWNDKENCIRAAKDCKTISEFQKKYSGAYGICYRNNWIQEIKKIFK